MGVDTRLPKWLRPQAKARPAAPLPRLREAEWALRAPLRHMDARSLRVRSRGWLRAEPPSRAELDRPLARTTRAPALPPGRGASRGVVGGPGACVRACVGRFEANARVLSTAARGLTRSRERDSGRTNARGALSTHGSVSLDARSLVAAAGTALECPPLSCRPSGGESVSRGAGAGAMLSLNTRRWLGLGPTGGRADGTSSPKAGRLTTSNSSPASVAGAGSGISATNRHGRSPVCSSQSRSTASASMRPREEISLILS